MIPSGTDSQPAEVPTQWCKKIENNTFNNSIDASEPLFWIYLHLERSKPNIWNPKMYKYRKSLKSYMLKIPKMNSQIHLKPTLPEGVETIGC